MDGANGAPHQCLCWLIRFGLWHVGFNGVEVKMIRALFAVIGLWTVALLAGDPSGAHSRQASLTGCLDEKPGPQYVLRGLNELRLIVNLEPEGFPVQSFAKHLGRKVTVQGILSSDDPPVMRVKQIQVLPGPCAPASEGSSADVERK
jgi:hypothetical protein